MIGGGRESWISMWSTLNPLTPISQDDPGQWTHQVHSQTHKKADPGDKIKKQYKQATHRSKDATE